MYGSNTSFISWADGAECRVTRRYLLGPWGEVWNKILPASLPQSSLPLSCPIQSSPICFPRREVNRVYPCCLAYRISSLLVVLDQFTLCVGRWAIEVSEPMKRLKLSIRPRVALSASLLLPAGVISEWTRPALWRYQHHVNTSVVSRGVCFLTVPRRSAFSLSLFLSIFTLQERVHFYAKNQNLDIIKHGKSKANKGNREVFKKLENIFNTDNVAINSCAQRPYKELRVAWDGG